MPLSLLCLSTDPELIQVLEDAVAPFGDAVTLNSTDPKAPNADLLASAEGILCGSFPEEMRLQCPPLTVGAVLECGGGWETIPVAL